MSPGQTEIKQGKLAEFISRAKGYFRETYKSQNINPISARKYLLPSCCIYDSLKYDMQHDQVLKQLNCDLLTLYPRVLGEGVCVQNIATLFRVPVHVELRVIHSETVKITHTFQDKTFFSLKMYRKSSLFIHSTESLISFILFRHHKCQYSCLLQCNADGRSYTIQ